MTHITQGEERIDYAAVGRERCEELAVWLIGNHSTVRETSKHFGVSKSTVHKDLTDRLRHVNMGLYNEAAEVLRVNKAERHIRGGMATKLMYDSRKKKG